MEPLKHECGVALIRLRHPLSYYRKKYGTYTYAIDKLYLMMEKQHNRGQEAAGVGVVKLDAPPGYELIFRERGLGKEAIQDIFATIGREIPGNVNRLEAEYVEKFTPYLGNVYMGHLRYSTTGKSGIGYAHPVLRRNNWRSRSLMLCGNFNMTNVDEMFGRIVKSGQHPRIFSDTNMILEQVGLALDKENHRLYRDLRQQLEDPELANAIEDRLDIASVLSTAAPQWDGGYVICGATGSGDMFALRDPHGIRPAFYYHDDEIVVLASERPVIQTVFNLRQTDVKELDFGEALIVNRRGEVALRQLLPKGDNRRCSFERIYFSRGSDADIYRERKALGANLVPGLLKMIDDDTSHTVLSCVPNTAEAAFFGMVQEFDRVISRAKAEKIKRMIENHDADAEKIREVLSETVRFEKIAVKDVKMRTFIAEGSTRNDLANHVYDVTYGTVIPGVDTLVAIDDSIVRGTTLRQSILRQLDRLAPRRIIIVSSSPQVRYPDYYGIDMSSLSQFIAFHAAIRLLRLRNMEHIIHSTYSACLGQREKAAERENCVKAIYAPFTDEEISESITAILVKDAYPAFTSRIEILYQSLDGLHDAIPDYPGDWYFSGDYPTPGGTRMVNEAYIDWYESTYIQRDPGVESDHPLDPRTE